MIAIEGEPDRPVETVEIGNEMTERLVGLAQQQRVLPVQLVELGAQCDGTIDHVAVFRTRAGIDGDRLVLVAGEDAYGHG